MNDTPTLPGTLPGLLQPGAPVIWLDCVHERNDPCAGWCVAPPRATRFDAGHCAVVLAGDDDVCFVALDRLALDLSHPMGQARAVCWHLERTGRLFPAKPEQIEALRLACLAVGEVSGG